MDFIKNLPFPDHAFWPDLARPWIPMDRGYHISMFFKKSVPGFHFRQNPWISSKIWHQHIRFVRFCKFLDKKKKNFDGGAIWTHFKKKQFHDDISVQSMDSSEFFNIILKSEMLISFSWFFTNVVIFYWISWWGGIIWSTFQKKWVLWFQSIDKLH